MKRWRIRPSRHLLASELVQQVLAGVGTPHLAANCLRAMHKVLPTTFCTVYVVGADGHIETVSAASSYGTLAERTAVVYVERRYDRRDPHMLWLAKRKLPAQPQLWLGQHSGEDLADAEFRAACYDDVGIRERASVLQLSPTGERTAVSFYRSFTQPAFDAGDFAVMEQHAAFLAEAVSAHGRSRPAAANGGTSSLESRMLALSLREREVVGELLQGRTAKEAARALGIEATTVRTLQYRAFRRLGIRTTNELLRAGGGRQQ
jgi:DNA-binding CsgD family transcriptional regulator